MQEFVRPNSSVMVITGRSNVLGLTSSDLCWQRTRRRNVVMKAKLAVIAFGAFVLIRTIKAWPRWDERFTKIEQSTRDWYKTQEMNPATWERFGSPSWNSCCEKGDVFHTQFRVVNN